MVVYSDKIFPNYGLDEKFRCQIRQTGYHRNWLTAPAPRVGSGVVTEGGIRAMPPSVAAPDPTLGAGAANQSDGIGVY